MGHLHPSLNQLQEVAFLLEECYLKIVRQIGCGLGYERGMDAASGCWSVVLVVLKPVCAHLFAFPATLVL